MKLDAALKQTCYANAINPIREARKNTDEIVQKKIKSAEVAEALVIYVRDVLHLEEISEDFDKLGTRHVSELQNLIAQHNTNLNDSQKTRLDDLLLKTQKIFPPPLTLEEAFRKTRSLEIKLVYNQTSCKFDAQNMTALLSNELAKDFMDMTVMPALLPERYSNEGVVSIYLDDPQLSLSEEYLEEIKTVITTGEQIKEMFTTVTRQEHIMKGYTTLKALQDDPIIWPLIENNANVLSAIERKKQYEKTRKEELNARLKVQRELAAAKRKKELEDFKSGKIPAAETVPQAPKINIALVSAINRFADIKKKEDESIKKGVKLNP